jgi:hypothetical protein
VFGPVYRKEGWRIGDKELQMLIKEENIVKRLEE